MLLLLDEVEKPTWEAFPRTMQTELRGPSDGDQAPVKPAPASRSPLPRLLPDLGAVCHSILVARRDEATTRAFINCRLRGSTVQFSDAEIAQLHRESGGLPRALETAAFERFRQKRAGPDRAWH